MQHISQAIIISAFKRSGIFPFNPSVVPKWGNRSNYKLLDCIELETALVNGEEPDIHAILGRNSQKSTRLEYNEMIESFEDLLKQKRENRISAETCVNEIGKLYLNPDSPTAMAMGLQYIYNKAADNVANKVSKRTKEKDNEGVHKRYRKGSYEGRKVDFTTLLNDDKDWEEEVYQEEKKKISEKKDQIQSRIDKATEIIEEKRKSKKNIYKKESDTLEKAEEDMKALKQKEMELDQSYRSKIESIEAKLLDN
jgi:hypothetical protein